MFASPTLRVLRIVATLVTVLAVAAPVAASEISEGVIVFRLTIRGGPIPPTDGFSLAVNDLTPPGIIISPGFRCGAGSEDYNPAHVPCEERNYDWRVGTPTFGFGEEFSYTFARGSEILHEGTVTLSPGTQVITVVYDYSLGQPTLPDTALEPTNAAASEPGDAQGTLFLLEGRDWKARPV